MKKNRAKISYEPEADVLMWEITDKPIDYAKEIGNVVVHFTKDNTPVLIEILEASKFLARVKNLVKKTQISIREPILTP
ncbi:MAG: hypothetical protein COY72_01955 [Candidatus Nealsonbacteria bacterium CG_4_10_14_0_8_um_filter_35_10]|uniref:DUF2283 domain-containing protein n=1 Tax=Candidatus Nealsonbacteria bacterium CG_4_10_14_0_8_um_filter_35_10 TaxID=1974683 RepID=A0A2M7R7Z1_9BACT|nr:MAG: hypothetical protein COY72_01955 [Candidatus Nealsonbacteria bacterium CG_4_10_14_0_8_um_filter_35_10]